MDHRLAVAIVNVVNVHAVLTGLVRDGDRLVLSSFCNWGFGHRSLTRRVTINRRWRKGRPFPRRPLAIGNLVRNQIARLPL